MMTSKSVDDYERTMYGCDFEGQRSTANFSWGRGTTAHLDPSAAGWGFLPSFRWTSQERVFRINHSAMLFIVLHQASNRLSIDSRTCRSSSIVKFLHASVPSLMRLEL